MRPPSTLTALLVRFVIASLALAVALASAAEQRDAQTPLVVTTRNGETIHIETETAAPDRLIVEFVRGTGSADARRALRERFRKDVASIRVATPNADGASARRPRIVREYGAVFSGAAVEHAAGFREAIRALPYVARVIPDRIYRTADTGSNSLIRADQLTQQYGVHGEGITVAIIDTGVDYNHPALGAGFGAGHKVVGGHDFVNDDDDPMDDAGHGTHVAGIIAADSPSLRGVAPGVTLVAYKALDSGGNGRESDLVAAFERAVDPNGDGDTSDHADVINASFGGPGGIDSPLATAASRAVAAGVIVCVAAGNSGRYGSIDSPGVAASVITVGASDQNDRIAFFSSRGPNSGDFAIKPEIVAPGVAIVSTLPGGTTGPKDGTSMATPHVAGVCALLRQLHRDWSPSDVKSALVSTAVPIADDLMATGAGRIDALAATATTIHLQPAHLSYGLDDVSKAVWSSAQTIHIANHGQTSQTVRLTVNDAALGQQLVVTPSSVTLGAGETRDVTVAVTIDNAAVPSPTRGSLALGGRVALSVAGQTLALPWGYVKAARALVQHAASASTTLFWTNAANFVISSNRLEDGSIDTLLPAGTYDLLLLDPQPPPAGSAFTLAGAAIAIREGMKIDGQIALDIPASEIRNAVRVAGRDDTGRLLSDLKRMDDVYPNTSGDVQWYSTRFLVEFPPDSQLASFALLSLTSNTLKISDFSKRLRLFAAEYYSDTKDTNKVFSQQYRAVAGMDSDVTLDPSPYLAQDVEFLFPPATTNRDFGFLHMLYTVKNGFYGGDGFTRGIRAPGEQNWRGTLYLTPDADARYVASIAASSNAEPHVGAGWSGPELETGLFRVIDGRTVVSSEKTTSPYAYVAEPHEVLKIGDGPITLTGYSYADGANFNGQAQATGPLEDRRSRASRFTRFALYREDTGQLVASRDSIPFTLVSERTAGAGRYRVVYHNTAGYAGSLTGTVTRTDWIDTARQDRIPPQLNGMRVLDGARHLSSHVAVNDSVKVVFALSDNVTDSTGKVSADTLDPAATEVYFRTARNAEWSRAPLREIADDRAAEGHRPIGHVYEADLAAAATAPTEVEVKIEGRDLAGNRTQHLFSPALVVGDYTRPVYPKRRAVR